MEAMTSVIGAPGSVSRSKISQLWQLPLLLFALAVFAVAAYLFITAKPGLSVGQKIDIARTFVRHDRPEAAIELVQRILSSDKMDAPVECQVHLLLGEAVDLKQ